MDRYNILNSIDNTLEKGNKNYNDSFVDNFIDELKSYLRQAENVEKLKKLPEDTLFTLDRYEGNYAVCENRTNGKMYDIPRSMVNPYAHDGDILVRQGQYYNIVSD